MAKYNQEMNEWRNSNPSNPNGISTNEVQQHLTLGKEPQATATVTSENNNVVYDRTISDAGDLQTDSQGKVYKVSSTISGTVLQVTYSNLSNSYYIDDNGTKHNLVKLVRTFSDSELFPVVSWGELWVYDDPTDGFWYNQNTHITVDDVYYDDSGNVVNFGSNAYIAITSLNSSYIDTNNNATLSGTAKHVEKATLLSSGKVYGLAGSSIVAHDNSLYADETNESARDWDGNLTMPQYVGNSLWPSDKANWDAIGTNEYFGAGLMAVSGTHITIRFDLAGQDTNAAGNGVWATMTTIIPQTPVPAKPTRKTTSVSYHYLVLAIFLIYCRFFPYSYSVLLEMRRTISWLSIHVIHYFTNTMTTGLVYIRSVQYGQLLSIRIG